jgi:hypothetical protein
MFGSFLEFSTCLSFFDISSFLLYQAVTYMGELSCYCCSPDKCSMSYNSDFHLLPGADDIGGEAMIVGKHFKLGKFQMQIAFHSKKMFGKD